MSNNNNNHNKKNQNDGNNNDITKMNQKGQVGQKPETSGNGSMHKGAAPSQGKPAQGQQQQKGHGQQGQIGGQKPETSGNGNVQKYSTHQEKGQESSEGKGGDNNLDNKKGGGSC